MAKLKTGRHTSALKELRKSKKRTKHNYKIKKNILQLTKKFKKVIREKDITTAKNLLSEVYSKIDKAAKKGIISKNKAARKKSQLSNLVPA